MKNDKYQALTTRNLLLVLLLLPLFAVAQPQLFPLRENPFLVKYKAPANKQAKALGDSIIDLPFLEDFSGGQYGYPDGTLFADSNVFVNPDFCIGPPTVGCATFDGLNSKGIAYGPYPLTGESDFLTSRPIDLDSVTAADSLYFSFTFQPQGRGEAPEQTDLFSLWFYNNTTALWVKVWETEAAPLDTFKLVMIPITDPAYYNNNFKFQFRRSAALYGMFDQWHVDYIYLNKNRTKNDTTFNDVGFVYKAPSMLRNYQQMPFNQYISSEYFGKIRLTQTNIADSAVDCTYRYYSTNYNVGTCDETLPSAQAPLEPVYTNGYNPDAVQTFPTLVNCGFPEPMTQDTVYSITHVFRDTSTPFVDMETRNDTLVFNQVFSDYYAYDDGTAEAGFVLSAPGGGSCAARYQLNFPDTLRGVHFYFVKDGIQDVSGREFYLRVWGPSSSNPDLPGDVLYEKRGLFPQYADSLNEFVTYTIDSVFQLPVGNFFVGWYQADQYSINIGYDKNTVHNDRLYYKVTTNNWAQVSDVGSLMMRPVVGDNVINPLGINEPVQARNVSNIILYPNPANDRVFIGNAADFGNKPVTYSIFNIQGLLIESGQLTYAQIDISAMSNGLYFVRFDGHNTSATRKLIIAR
jgi:hypothetical protein